MNRSAKGAEAGATHRLYPELCLPTGAGRVVPDPPGYTVRQAGAKVGAQSTGKFTDRAMKQNS